ncbi:hypothetical protein E3T40_12965 [Cryobacterium sp. TMT1-19]|uniref:hypothetical protein n=1 Tax=Cryobacterium sp. TMT1-19 TaxID=1259231 RepID=UPI00106BB1F8|nr:hypothetical protein [Cryobacterium sp. TMT1-19]TFD32401.1 hypothetical protein E3T40_12965 [Cryobacterium sp. TMT1-19]
MVRDHGFKDAYSLAQRDPAYLAAVRVAYSGEKNVLNALWWATHPAEAAPDGSPSPANQLRDLQKRVFSANGDSVGDPKATAALRELQATVAADRAAIAAAIRAAEFAVNTQPPRSPGESTAPRKTGPRTMHEGTSEGSLQPFFEEVLDETALPASGRDRNALLVLGILVALGVGFVVGTLTNASLVTASPSADPVNAEDTCGQVSDVVTLMHNAYGSLLAVPSTQQEFEGAARLVARLSARVDTVPGSAVADQVEALKGLLPSSASEQIDPLSTEWGQALARVSAACSAAGFDISVDAWIGG